MNTQLLNILNQLPNYFYAIIFIDTIYNYNT